MREEAAASQGAARYGRSVPTGLIRGRLQNAEESTASAPTGEPSPDEGTPGELIRRSCPRRRAEALLAALAVLVPVLLTAAALWPEGAVHLPRRNDDAYHFLLVQRASEAWVAGENPLDPWVPEHDLGFPHLLYYQHLPHLAVVVLHRLLPGPVSLLAVFDWVRYLLLIGFPLTVYWAMRRMAFPVPAAAVAAAASTLLSSQVGYGFEYGSYLWRGSGLTTQLWAMHLAFVALACLDRLLARGTGYAAAVVACAALALSHLLYSYMLVPAAVVLCLIGLTRENGPGRLARLAVVAALAAAATAYFWLPFLRLQGYLNASAYEARWKYDSFGAPAVLAHLARGELLDDGRLPVLTAALALGLAAAGLTRTRPARIGLGLLLVWLAFFFGRPTWGPLLDLVPLAGRLHLHRLVGGVHLAAVLLIGLGGDWAWRRMAPLGRWRPLAAGALLLAWLGPALHERQVEFGVDRIWIAHTRAALAADRDAPRILAALAAAPPGRTYAGRRDNWGQALEVGKLRLFDLLTFHRVPTTAPYTSFSLNGDLFWAFDERNPAHYDLFDVRYVVLPRAGSAPPAFFHSLLATERYRLYGVDTTGYARFATVVARRPRPPAPRLLAENRAWMASDGPARGRVVRYDAGATPADAAAGAGAGSPAPAPDGARAAIAPAPAVHAARAAAAPTSALDAHHGGGSAGASALPAWNCPETGTVEETRIAPGRLELRTACPDAGTLVLKVTYHPHWRVTVDGRPAAPYMVSPSFLAVDLPPGAHAIHAEYRSPAYRTALAWLGAGVLSATVLLRRRLPRLETRLLALVARLARRRRGDAVRGAGSGGGHGGGAGPGIPPAASAP